MRGRIGPGVYYGSLVLALLLALLALPPSLAPLKPFWLGLLVIYWGLEAPEQMSLDRAFLIGLAGDLVSGTLLGEQALRLVVIAFIVQRLRPRMRFFPLPQQTLAVLALLVNDRIVVMMVRGFSGEGWPDWTFWLAPLAGALFWPWLFVLLDALRRRARVREA